MSAAKLVPIKYGFADARKLSDLSQWETPERFAYAVEFVARLNARMEDKSIWLAGSAEIEEPFDPSMLTNARRDDIEKRLERKHWAVAIGKPYGERLYILRLTYE